MGMERERACFACGHIHDPKSPGKCWEAACLDYCPEDHGDFEGPYPYTPDAAVAE